MQKSRARCRAAASTHRRRAATSFVDGTFSYSAVFSIASRSSAASGLLIHRAFARHPPDDLPRRARRCWVNLRRSFPT